MANQVGTIPGVVLRGFGNGTVVGVIGLVTTRGYGVSDAGPSPDHIHLVRLASAHSRMIGIGVKRSKAINISAAVPSMIDIEVNFGATS